MNVIRNAANQIRQSSVVIVIFIAFCILAAIGSILWLEDYNTSRMGYSTLPTRKFMQQAIWAVALLPQIGQITFTYLYLSDTANKYKRFGLLIALCLMIADCFTDVWYKANGLGVGVWLIAVVESFVIYTLGSEIAITVSFPMVVDLFPDALTVFVNTVNKMINALTEDER